MRCSIFFLLLFSHFLVAQDTANTKSLQPDSISGSFDSEVQDFAVDKDQNKEELPIDSLRQDQSNSILDSAGSMANNDTALIDPLANAKEETYFYSNGAVKAKGKLLNDKRVGRWMTYFPSGTNNAKENYKDGVLDGPVEYYDQNGQLSGREIWRDGMLVDSAFYLHPTGRLRKAGRFHDGQYCGNWYFFYKSGVLERIGCYDDGVPDGLWTFYHPNGQPAQCGYFKDGKEDGLWQFYDEKGRIKFDGTFSDGVRIGFWHEYKKNGRVKETFVP